MHGLKAYVYPGFGEYVRDNLGYSQAIRIGDRIECSGQGTPCLSDLPSVGIT